MTDDSIEKSTVIHNPAQSHLTLMSVMFGVVVGFWVSTVHNHDNWSTSLVISAALTLVVVVCVYWWYINLCALYPSHSLIHYSIDFAIVISLCSMSKSCGDESLFLWIIAWGVLAGVASLKVWVGAGPIHNHPHPCLVWPPRITSPIIFFIGFYSGMLAYDSYQSSVSSSIPCKLLAWLPVVFAIIITFVVAHVVKKK